MATKPTYEWRGGRYRGLDAQTVGEALDRLSKRLGGEVTSDAVLDEARDIQSPLHDAFDWDDSEAAEKYRRLEARWLLRRVVVIRNKEPAQPAWVSVRIKREDATTNSGTRTAHVYRTPAQLQGNKSELEAALQNAYDRLDAARRAVEELNRIARISGKPTEALAAALAGYDTVREALGTLSVAG